MEIINKGQNVEIWTDQWEKNSVESLIQQWDFWGIRQWILKYTPRYGKSLEAGCGLGRNNFYLESLGIDIDGLDFSVDTISHLNNWKLNNGFLTNFIPGDITALPYPDSSLSGYLSFGVIEHFIEGPHKALSEAYRVLRPGGIAVITTPGISFNIFYCNLKNFVKKIIKKIIFFRKFPSQFVQYWYNPKQLKKFLEDSDFYVSRYSSADLMFAFCEASGFSDKWIKKGTFGYWFSQRFETSKLKFLGAQSVTISIKLAPVMHCFFCGELSAKPGSLEIYDVPVCDSCSVLSKPLVNLYLKNKKVSFAQPFTINPPIMAPQNEECSFCRKEYFTHPLFEDYGFNRPVCYDCLKKPEVNILLSNFHVKPVWRA